LDAQRVGGIGSAGRLDADAVGQAEQFGGDADFAGVGRCGRVTQDHHDDLFPVAVPS